MSYAPSIARIGPLAGIGPWGRNAAETDEVYLWRARLIGANVRRVEDVQAIAAAIGAGQNLGLDLRGVAVEASGSGGEYAVDAAFTSKLPRVYLLDPTLDDAGDIAIKAQTALAERFPGAQFADAHFDVIDDASPKHPALDFWRFHPVIYEAQFLGSMVPTQAFARFEGLYRGNAEQGLQLKPWPKEDPFPPGNGTDAAAVGTTALWIVGAAAVAWLVYRASTKGAAA